ncbi:MAG: hypothetical protein HXY24_12250 [Rubrivivax sp.]|nr:hypothetical protein [Rubrivivax sp.]
MEILLAHQPALTATNPCILEAYQSVLQEEGVPYRIVDVEELASLSPRSFPGRPAIILPDGISQALPERFDGWMKKYLEEGGNVLIGYDAGTKDQNGLYRDQAIFAEMIGLNYILYNQGPEYSYSNGSLRFADRTAMELFEIPPGKVKEDLAWVGYQYGPIEYPFARSIVTKEIDDRKILAYMADKSNKKYPAIMETRYGKGRALYVSVPLGYLKCHSDDLPLRSAIRFFLFKSLKIPHLMSAPGGKGGITINWHIDTNAEWIYLPFLKKKGYFRDSLKYSFHITAGDYRLEVGDRQGFDASGKGRKFVEMIKPYGVIGSHGGWGHDWFANKVNSGEFTEREIEKYITKNNKSLEEITGYRIEEYSAPVGVHPQPVATNVIERLGMIAYYYTGDQGSGPNRTFANGKRVSDRVIAFPVMNFGDVISLGEMKRHGKTPNEVYGWLTGVVDYAAKNRVVRLIYSHPNDVKYYPKTVSDFLDYLSSLQNEGKLRIETMTFYARFFLRFLMTAYDFTYEGEGLSVRVKNSEGLQDVTVAIPKHRFSKPESPPSGVSFDEDENYLYFTVQEEGAVEKVFNFRRR